MPVFIAGELRRHGFEAIILSRSKKLLAFAKEQGVPSIRSWWWSRQNWSGMKALLFPIYVGWQVILFFYYVVIFIKLRPSIVHLQAKDDFIAGTFAARALGIRAFWSDYADLKHIWLNHGVWYKNPIGKFVYLAAHLADTIVVVSREDKRLIAANIPNGAIKRKLKIIHNGFADIYKPAKKTTDFISTARLVTDKGIAELIEAFSWLVAEFPTATLAIVGDGPEKERFKNQARGIKGITFKGYQREPLPFLARSKVFVLPTYHEGFSIALVEACMSGLAIIATDVGGNSEIIVDKKDGLLVPAKNVDALYEAMKKLYKNTGLQETLGAKAREKFMKSYELSDVVEKKFLPLYEGRA